MTLNDVGRMNWNACKNCRHYPPERGGCDVEAGPEDFELEGDWLICTSFRPKDAPKKQEVA